MYGFESRRRTTDALDVDEASRGFDLDLDTDMTTREPGRLLELVEHQRHRLDLARCLHFGQHHDVEPRARRGDDGDEIIDRERRVPRVDTYADHFVVPLDVVQRRDGASAGCGLFGGRDRVFEIEKDHVGRKRCRLGDHLVARRRHRQARATRKMTRAAGHCADCNGRVGLSRSPVVEVAEELGSDRTHAVTQCLGAGEHTGRPHDVIDEIDRNELVLVVPRLADIAHPRRHCVEDPRRQHAADATDEPHRNIDCTSHCGSRERTGDRDELLRTYRARLEQHHVARGDGGRDALAGDRRGARITLFEATGES